MVREHGVLSAADVERRWHNSYIPSQRFKFATVRPTEHADSVVHNDEFKRPVREARTL